MEAATSLIFLFDFSLVSPFFPVWGKMHPVLQNFDI